MPKMALEARFRECRVTSRNQKPGHRMAICENAIAEDQHYNWVYGRTQNLADSLVSGDNWARSNYRRYSLVGMGIQKTRPVHSKWSFKMFRGNSSLSKPLQMIIKFFTKENKNKNPWKSDLDELAEKYGEPLTPQSETTQSQLSVLSPTSAQTEEKFKKLIEEVNEAKQEAAESPDRIVVRTLRKDRVGAETTPDMKAWWGQSVATWDPIDEKNLDSVEQTRRPRTTRWFD
jgi:hypothetical protein